MKWYQKIYEVITFFLLGVIAGIFLYVKMLDEEEYKVVIEKIKNKNGELIINTNQPQQEEEKKEIKNKFFKKIFKKKNERNAKK